ncbi:MAG: hypothetical protein IPK75_20360 [Acidobacteria bacterium]|nr:hypothetical protein [Acidobacteriota bacterium]
MKHQETTYALLRTPIGATIQRIRKMHICPKCELHFTEKEKAKHRCEGLGKGSDWVKRPITVQLTSTTPFAWGEADTHPGQRATAVAILADFIEDQAEAERLAASYAANVLAHVGISGLITNGAEILQKLGKTAYDYRPKVKFSYTTPNHGDGSVMACNEVDAREAIANRLNVERLPRGIKITKEAGA